MKKQTVNKYIIITLGALLLINAAVAAYFYNSHAGIIIEAALGVCFLGYGLFFKKLAAVLPRFIKIIAVSCLALLAVAVGFVYIFGSVETLEYDEDAVIVLGCSVIGDEPSESLKKRLECAADYYGNNPNCIIVVTGGKGDDENLSEAQAMENYLSQLGIPAERIIKEDKATDTLENFAYSKQLLDNELGKNYKVAVISSKYHIFRAENIAKSQDYGEITHRGSGVEWYMFIPSGLREVFANVNEVLK